jgi:hypothetical protein
MSTRYNNGSHYENHRKAAEILDGAAHAHLTGEQNGKQEHLTGHEQSRHAAEHSGEAHQWSPVVTNGHGLRTFGHHEIAELAVELWRVRGCPEGSSAEDWFRALEILRAGSHSH